MPTLFSQNVTKVRELGLDGAIARQRTVYFPICASVSLSPGTFCHGWYGGEHTHVTRLSNDLFLMVKYNRTTEPVTFYINDQGQKVVKP